MHFNVLILERCPVSYKFHGNRRSAPRTVNGHCPDLLRWQWPGSPREGIGDADVLGVEVFLDAFEAAFASQSGLLDAAERCGGVGDNAGVQAEHAGLELFAHPDAAVQVAGEDVRHQPVLGIVG